jgi:hypothetical protein
MEAHQLLGKVLAQEALQPTEELALPKVAVQVVDQHQAMVDQLLLKVLVVDQPVQLEEMLKLVVQDQEVHQLAMAAARLVGKELAVDQLVLTAVLALHQDKVLALAVLLHREVMPQLQGKEQAQVLLHLRVATLQELAKGLAQAQLKEVMPQPADKARELDQLRPLAVRAAELETAMQLLRLQVET